jgi:hypothetical protein
MKKHIFFAVIVCFILVFPGLGFSQNCNIEAAVKEERLSVKSLKPAPRSLGELEKAFAAFRNKSGLRQNSSGWIFSDDPEYLEPLAGTRWAFGYTIGDTYIDTIRFEKEVQSLSDGVALICADQYINMGFVKYELDLESFVIFMPSMSLDYMYIFNTEGEEAYGLCYVSYCDVEDIYSMAGIISHSREDLDEAVTGEREKWDVGNDNQMGLGEAVRALDIVKNPPDTSEPPVCECKDARSLQVPASDAVEKIPLTKKEEIFSRSLAAIGKAAEKRSSSRNASRSANALRPVTGTTWIFAYTVDDSVWIDSISFEEEIEYSSEGTAMVICSDLNGSFGAVAYDNTLGFMAVIQRGPIEYAYIFRVLDDQAYGFCMILASSGEDIYPMAGALSYTTTQLDKIVDDERKRWDADDDNSIGLGEVIRALQVLAGKPEETTPK